MKVEAFRIFDEGKGINLGEAMDSEGRALETDDVEGGGGRGFRFLLKKFEQKGKVEVVLVSDVLSNLNIYSIAD